MLAVPLLSSPTRVLSLLTWAAGPAGAALTRPLVADATGAGFAGWRLPAAHAQHTHHSDGRGRQNPRGGGHPQAWLYEPTQAARKPQTSGKSTPKWGLLLVGGHSRSTASQLYATASCCSTPAIHRRGCTIHTRNTMPFLAVHSFALYTRALVGCMACTLAVHAACPWGHTLLQNTTRLLGAGTVSDASCCLQRWHWCHNTHPRPAGLGLQGPLAAQLRGLQGPSPKPPSACRCTAPRTLALLCHALLWSYTDTAPGARP